MEPKRRRLAELPFRAPAEILPGVTRRGARSVIRISGNVTKLRAFIRGGIGRELFVWFHLTGLLSALKPQIRSKTLRVCERLHKPVNFGS